MLEHLQVFRTNEKLKFSIEGNLYDAFAAWQQKYCPQWAKLTDKWEIKHWKIIKKGENHALNNLEDILDFVNDLPIVKKILQLHYATEFVEHEILINRCKQAIKQLSEQ